MKIGTRYWVLVDYGSYEGMKIWVACDDLSEAIAAREEAMKSTMNDTFIVRPVNLEITEAICD